MRIPPKNIDMCLSVSYPQAVLVQANERSTDVIMVCPGYLKTSTNKSHCSLSTTADKISISDKRKPACMRSESRNVELRDHVIQVLAKNIYEFVFQMRWQSLVILHDYING